MPKPSWNDESAPWNWLAQDEDGRWYWYSVQPVPGIGGGVWRSHSSKQKFACQSEPNPNWLDSLQQRPK